MPDYKGFEQDEKIFTIIKNQIEHSVRIYPTKR